MDHLSNTKVTVLIVDDNPVNIRFIELILQKEGYHSISTPEGLEAIEMATRLSPDIILLDITMPEISGIEVCRMLKADERTADIPIIFVTANTGDETLKEAFASGGNDYVRKPVSRVELIARIRACLREKELLKKTLEQEKLRAVLETAGAICHEMNQPLQFLTWISGGLFHELPEGSPLREQAASIKTHVDRLSEIVRKLANITTYKTRPYVKGHYIIDIDKASAP